MRENPQHFKIVQLFSYLVITLLESYWVIQLFGYYSGKKYETNLNICFNFFIFLVIRLFCYLVIRSKIIIIIIIFIIIIIIIVIVIVTVIVMQLLPVKLASFIDKCLGETFSRLNVLGYCTDDNSVDFWTCRVTRAANNFFFKNAKMDLILSHT